MLGSWIRHWRIGGRGVTDTVVSAAVDCSASEMAIFNSNFMGGSGGGGRGILLGVRKMSAKLSSLERTDRNRGAKPQGLRRGRKRLDTGGISGVSRTGSGAGRGISRESSGEACVWDGGSMSLGGGAGWRTLLVVLALCTGTAELGVSLERPSAGGLGLAISSSITTRVGWGTRSTFCVEPHSWPGLVLDRCVEEEGVRWVRLKGSRHNCSGSGGLSCEAHRASCCAKAGGWLQSES